MAEETMIRQEIEFPVSAPLHTTITLALLRMIDELAMAIIGDELWIGDVGGSTPAVVYRIVAWHHEPPYFFELLRIAPSS